MFELANTSLPNGLIPGTHGFATVAMTKGLPDALRQRLEALCAYTHRQSAHDDRYFRENPVNWFHVALPTGEHAMGRVAACDFDYTGRTNRLARMLVFLAREMPRVGAARVLSAEKARFSAPWSGEPRWLAPDAATATRLASSAAPVGANPSAWTAKFGADGATIAQRFALLLEKTVRDGGKPIYFKTSAASDIDGTGLLSLFADLIDLLPPDLRSSVTFSTYPDALPNGTRCHLRGAFDGDRAFAAASALQPWVDCEQGRVMHEEMLPVPKAPPRPVAPTPATSPRLAQQGGAPSATNTPGAGAAQPRSQSYFPKPTQSKWLPPERKNSERNFYIALGSVAAAVVVAFAAGLWLMQKRQPTVVPPPGVEEADGADSDAIAKPKKDKEELGTRGAAGERGDDAAGELDTGAEKRPGVAEAVASSEVLAADVNEQTQPTNSEPLESVSESQRKFEFLGATKFEIVERARLSDTEFIKSHEEMTIFYYDDAQCEELKKCGTIKSKTKLGDTYYSPKLDEYRQNIKGRFVIFYCSDKNESATNEVFWLWLLSTNPENGEDWFKSSETHDLRHEVFGSEENVFDFYKKNAGEPTYTVTRSTQGEENEKDIVLATEKKTNKSTASLDLFVPDDAEKARQLEKCKGNVNMASNNLNGVEFKVQQYNEKVDNLKSDITNLKNALRNKNSYDEKIKGEKDPKKKKDWREKSQNANKDVSRFAESVSATASAIKLSVDVGSLKKCKDEKAVDALFDIRKKDAKDERERFQPALREAINALNNFEADWPEKWRKLVKSSKFAITEVSGSKEKKGGAQ